MRTHNHVLLVLATAGAACAATLLFTLGTSSWTAHAEEPEIGFLDEAPVEAPQPQLRCRTFAVALGDTLDLPGGEGEIAEWVRAQEGYEVWAVDYEAVQKANGYPQHLVQVCLSS